MFKEGDYIVYGSNGVCKVEKIGQMNMTGVPKEKIYYTLAPVYTKGSRVFTPIDNDKVIMRPVISKDEAYELVDDIRNIEFLWIQDERKREEIYKEAFRKCNCKELVKIVKTIYMRKESRLAEGKKITANDEHYFRMAEENLYGELAIPFEMEKEKVKEFIMERVEGTA